MDRSRSRRAAAAWATAVACACLCVVGVALPAAPVAADPEDPDGTGAVTPAVPEDPLRVDIDRVTPSTVPESGRVTVTGRIRNRSDAQWTDLQVYLLTSQTPLTTPEELDAAVRSDPRTEISAQGRITDAGLYGTAEDLSPHERTRFRLSLPREELGIPDEAGVYWLGVQVLGTENGIRLDGADGRARIFLPLVPPDTDPVQAVMALQLRQPSARTPDGRLAREEQWRRTLRPSGRLGRLLRLTGSAHRFPLAWVVDPALVTAARSLAAGNPPVSLEPPEAAAGSGNGSEEASGSGAGGPAQHWVDRFSAEAAGRTVLALPYGDTDVSALVGLTSVGGQALLEQAYAAGESVLGDVSVTATRAVAPPSGFLSPEALDGLEPGTTAVLGPDALPEQVQGAGSLVLGTGGRVLVAPTGDDVRGPAPGAPSSALAVRQQLLAEAAVHALAPTHDVPMVWVLPPRWNPGPQWRAADLFGGLRVGWLRPLDARRLLTDPRSPDPSPGVPTEPETLDPQDVQYPDEEQQAQLGATVVSGARRAMDRAGLLDQVLAEDTGAPERVRQEALLATSVWNRPDHGRAARRVRQVANRVEGWLDSITVRGPSFVTMSDATGTFQVTVVNGLDVPVDVKIDAVLPRGALSLQTPGPIRIAAHGRGPVPIQAHATDIGIHLVTLQPVSAQGDPVGRAATLSIRSSRVGFFLWLVMGVGGAVLFVVVIVRIWRRFRERRATHGPLLRSGDRTAGRPGDPGARRSDGRGASRDQALR